MTLINFRIRELRRQKGMTQAELAQNMGVTQSVVAMWERGANMPSASKLPKMADLFGCTIDELFDRDPPGRDGA